MSGLLGERAVVIGGGIGGLSAAGALAGYFAQVDVVERDHLTASVGTRTAFWRAACRRSARSFRASTRTLPLPAPYP